MKRRERGRATCRAGLAAALGVGLACLANGCLGILGVTDIIASDVRIPCTPGTQRCAVDAGLSPSLETCTADREWEGGWTCQTGTCASGACTGSTASARSCASVDAPGLNNCGVEQTASCCSSVEVPGGTYFRVYDPLVAEAGPTLSPDGGPTDESFSATAGGFLLDKYLVTVGRFRQFVAAVKPTDAGPGGYTPPAGSGKHVHLNGGFGLVHAEDPEKYESGWNPDWNAKINPTDAHLLDAGSTWTADEGPDENLPITSANWYEAYAFFIWDGGFLPSEAEWEYAAAGGDEQREYPWGSTDPGRDNRYAVYGDDNGRCYYPSVGECAFGELVKNIAPVGTASRGAGRWGQLDLAGEVDEWTLDWYAGSYTNQCTNCSYLAPLTMRAIRGGAFFLGIFALLPSQRQGGMAPADRQYAIGFRCARLP